MMARPLSETQAPVLWRYLRHACTSVPGAAAPRRLLPLAGDASARRYYRVGLQPGSSMGESAVLMELPADSAPLTSEEATEGGCPIDELPFVNVARHLARAGVRVPAIYDVSENNRLILLEDLGSTHLYDIVTAEGRRAEALALFGAAIDVMAQMHERARRPVEGDDCTAFYQRLSERLYRWEFDHFIEYGVEARLGAPLPEAEGRAIRTRFAAISGELSALPRVFTHRDFHSQNILIKEGRIALIDFQDALMGPVVYDLASLLRDRYFGLSEEEVDGFLHRYLAGRPESPEAQMAFAELRRLFDWQVLQRNMKAAGRFVYLDRVRGKPHLLVHLPDLFASMRAVIARRAELEPLAQVVERAAAAP